MRVQFAVVIALVAAGDAAALSCVPMDVGLSYEAANARPEAFVIALGALTGSGEGTPKAPVSGDPNMRESYTVHAQFDGHFATPDGFTVPREVPVTVEVGCVSVWCGSESLSGRGLYFLRRDAPGAYALEAGPCPQFFYENPSADQLSEVLDRLR